MKLSFLLMFALVFFACSDDDPVTGDPGGDGEKGTLTLKMTDAPIDNAEVKSCFVTIAEVKVDDKKVEAFSKTTVDILAYQRGETFLLGDLEVDASQYSEIELVLDHESNSDGTMPGCYIEENDGTIHALASNDISVEIDTDFTVEKDQSHELVLDMDLRKCIKSESGSSSNYSFVTKAELESAFRVSSEQSAVIKGNCDDLLVDADLVVAYVYKKGTYDRDNEMSVQGQSQIEFAGAVNSSACDSNGNFEMHFINDGEYELHFMAYDRESDGSLSLKGSLNVNVLAGLDILGLNISGSSNVEVNVVALGIIG